MPNAGLVAAVDLVIDMVEAVEPRAMRKRLLSGLVDDLGVDAAMVWAPGTDGGLALRGDVGLTGAIAESLAAWPPGSPADRIARSAARSPTAATLCHVDADEEDRILYVMALPEPSTELLGVLVRRQIDAAFATLLESVGRAYAVGLRRAAVLRDNQHVVDAMVGELRPGDVPLPPGYRIGHVYRSATTNVPIGGDLYDWFRTDRGQLGIAVGDVSGKGMQAASRAAMAVHSLRALALPGAAPHVTAQMLNTIVTGQTGSESFVTLVYARVDPAIAKVEYVLAGHPPPLVLRGSGVEVLDVPSDVPLGVSTGTGFQLHQTVLDPGDRLVLYTDGVTEARADDGGGRLLGLAGLVDLLAGIRDRSPQQISDAVWAGIQSHTGGETADDCAVVVLGHR